LTGGSSVRTAVIPPTAKQKGKLSKSQRPNFRMDGGLQYEGTNGGSVKPRAVHVRLAHQNSRSIQRFFVKPRPKRRMSNQNASSRRQPNRYPFIPKSTCHWETGCSRHSETVRGRAVSLRFANAVYGADANRLNVAGPKGEEVVIFNDCASIVKPLANGIRGAHQASQIATRHGLVILSLASCLTLLPGNGVERGCFLLHVLAAALGTFCVYFVFFQSEN